MTTVYLDIYEDYYGIDGELVGVSVIKPEPGERCQVCDRRVNKPRQASSPHARRVAATLPPERAAAVEEGLEHLQAYVGADSTSYPRGTMLELLLLLGGQHREELRRYFSERGDFNDSDS